MSCCSADERKIIHGAIDRLRLDDQDRFFVEVLFDIYLPGICGALRRGKAAEEAIRPMLSDLGISH